MNRNNYAFHADCSYQRFNPYRGVSAARIAPRKYRGRERIMRERRNKKLKELAVGTLGTLIMMCMIGLFFYCLLMPQP